MYRRIEAKEPVAALYAQTLVRRGDLEAEEAEAVQHHLAARLESTLDEVRGEMPPALRGLPQPDTNEEPAPTPETGVPQDLLLELAELSWRPPQGFTLHPKLERQFAQRTRMLDARQVDWSLAEALAFGSLLEEGVDVRLTGQDSRRGTFSQRHAVLVDYVTGDEFVPLAHLAETLPRRAGDPGAPTPSFGKFTARDSLLSEYAALAFEYGYSVEAPGALVAWEAQFGDFVNAAQVVLDNFLVAAEEKWDQHAGLVLLLPHGYEGQGPEHSSARVERLLALCARGNVRVAQPSSAAQYFHLLRSQVHMARRTPLVVVTPKSLLRAAATRSPLEALSSGSFREVIDDAGVAEPTGIRRVVLGSGKVALEAIARRDALPDPGMVAVVRIEQLYPWPEGAIGGVLRRYRRTEEVVWLQEEPENMGAWAFVRPRLQDFLRNRYLLRHVARKQAASPATGSTALHQLEQADLLERAIG
jgi:2-oxoglutarate dehydrogenase E1 component